MLNVRNIDDLYASLPSINVIAPARSNGRTKDQVEIYSIVRLLGTLPIGPGDFPLQLDKSERPDFILQCGERQVGVEHTEAIPPNAAKEAAIRSQGAGEELHFLRRASVDEPRKSSKLLAAEIDANSYGSSWGGDSVEREWSGAMAYFIKKKLSVAEKQGFKLLDATWLLIYDNWPAPALDPKKGIEFLRAHLSEIAPWTTFEHVFILDEKVLLDLSEVGAVSYQVNHCLPT
ncbi:hypothetical protein ACEN9F_09295 [Duganella sp. CT11-25]|uniref:hypothetical protein n=1 Tax=unclassified Duganella TaxID=2636909 RepID=UPI0039B037C1